jgi:hypothetical protein
MSAPQPVLVHAVALAVAADADGPLCGALLLGDAGAGKSSLALALIETCPWRRTALVADDAVLIEVKGRGLTARAPGAIAGLIEVRGFGPAHVRSIPAAPITAAFDLGAASERVPEPGMFQPFADGPTAPLFPFRADSGDLAAPHRLRLIIRTILVDKSRKAGTIADRILGTAEHK